MDQPVRDALSTHLQDMLAAVPRLTLTTDQSETLLSFLADMLEVNRVMNLSAITDPQAVIYLHLLDSLTLLPILDQELDTVGREVPLTFLDVGTGAGFPAIPLKVARPQMACVMLDALAKRLKFIDREILKLALPGECRTVHGRAEELGHRADFREQFDFVTARALARLDRLLEYCLPLVKVGGLFCAMKGRLEGEDKLAAKACHLLGAQLEAVETFTLPVVEQERTLLYYRKLKACPSKYPRGNAQIKNHPL